MGKKIFYSKGREGDFQDIHITRMYSSFVTVSEGRIIRITDPFLKYCPLAHFLYRGIKSAGNSNSELIKAIKKAVEENISKFGSFTEKRKLCRKDIAIPYGASETMMYAMRKNVIDSAVLVCDGAGTVIVNRPEIVQGIGARMNGLFYTTPIDKIIERLEKYDCEIVFPETADIKQIEGLRRAAELGSKKIAVTINGSMGESLKDIKEIEKDNEVLIISLVVCTTGVKEERIEEIKDYADLVWSCTSEGIRKKIGKKAILQLSTAIPVFALTEKGLNFLTGYSNQEELIRKLDPGKQYLISGKHEGKKIRIGNFNSYLSEAKLPVRSKREPRPLT